VRQEGLRQRLLQSEKELYDLVHERIGQSDRAAAERRYAAIRRASQASIAADT
jgi:hypothetical protein